MIDGKNGDRLRPLPPGWGVIPSSDLKTRSNGRILIGGAPLKIIRLSATGAALTRSWFAGQPVSAAPRHQQLARRLLDAGMANRRMAPTEHAPMATTVVIPVKDDENGLTRTLASLVVPPAVAGAGSVDRIIVIDDGSARPITVQSPAVEVIRSDRPGGPGPARQRALSRISTPAVAFVDAGVTIAPSDLAALVDELLDPAVVAAAPRVLSKPPIDGSGNAVSRYEANRSPIDLGPTESLVGPGRLVPYVPTACLVVRTETVNTIGGFDPGLRYGEDVDLVWRLADHGRIRYVPTAAAFHPPRRTLTAFIGQRRGYGTAAGPLATRHGDRVAPCAISPWSAVVSALVLAGSPLAAVATAIGTGLALRPKIEPLPDVTVEALQLTARGHWYGGLSLVTAAARTWSPALLVALLVLPWQRRRIGGVLLAGFCRRLLDGPKRPGPALADLGIGVVDDVSYATGVWIGAVRERSVRALLPAFPSWPKATEAG